MLPASPRRRARRRRTWNAWRARPALTRLRRALDRLDLAGSSRERTRLLNELAREERMLTRMLERYMAACPPPAGRIGRLRARD